MNSVRYVPLVLSVILVMGMVSYAQMMVPALSGGSTNVTLRVGYPDSLDESDVTDQYAFQLLAAEGIHVIPTYYDNPPLSYKGLLAGQQDIAYDETMGSLVSAQNTTCIGGYELGGVFLAVTGDNITSPSQLLGKTAADFGPGSILRFLNEYWFAQAGIPVNTVGPNPKSVFLEAGGENVETVHDLETGQAQEIVVDDFILSDLQNPSINNTVHNGPFHVLFYSPTNFFNQLLCSQGGLVEQFCKSSRSGKVPRRDLPGAALLYLKSEPVCHIRRAASSRRLPRSKFNSHPHFIRNNLRTGHMDYTIFRATSVFR